MGMMYISKTPTILKISVIDILTMLTAGIIIEYAAWYNDSDVST